jgi:hypothetical protein
VWLDGVRYGLTSRLAVAAAAGYGLAWPHGCGHWLPIRLPRTSLAALTSGFPWPDRFDPAAAVVHYLGTYAACGSECDGYRRGAVAPWRTAEISSI